MVDKLTLLFLSAELKMDDDDDEMNLEESVGPISYIKKTKLLDVVSIQ